MTNAKPTVTMSVETFNSILAILCVLPDGVRLALDPYLRTAVASGEAPSHPREWPAALPQAGEVAGE